MGQHRRQESMQEGPSTRPAEAVPVISAVIKREHRTCRPSCSACRLGRGPEVWAGCGPAGCLRRTARKGGWVWLPITNSPDSKDELGKCNLTSAPVKLAALLSTSEGAVQRTLHRHSLIAHSLSTPSFIDQTSEALLSVSEPAGVPRSIGRRPLATRTQQGRATAAEQLGGSSGGSVG